MKKIIIAVLTAAFIYSSSVPSYAFTLPFFNFKKEKAEVKEPVPKPVPLTFQDCYRLALKESELIAISVDEIKVTEAHFLQALSIMLPHFSFISTDFQEEKNSISTSGSGSLAPVKSSQRQFNVTETLFSGFKALAAIKGSKFERSQREYETERAEQLLLVDVANAFYLLAEERANLMVLRKVEEALTGRVKELVARENLGRSKPSEVASAKAQLYGVQADLELAARQEALARQLLEFLVGRPVREIADTYMIPATLMAKDYYLAKSDSRPDVKAAKFGWEVAKKEHEIADSDFLPTVDLAANYYTQRTALDKGTDWDVSLVVTVPIFDGALTLGKSKEASLRADQSRLLFVRTGREAPKDIEDAYILLDTSMAIEKARRKQYTTARLNFHLQKKDYERSLVNNLDVLAAPLATSILYLSVCT